MDTFLLVLGVACGVLGLVFAAGAALLPFRANEPLDCPRFRTRVVPLGLAGLAIIAATPLPFVRPVWDGPAYVAGWILLGAVGYLRRTKPASRTAVRAGFAVLLLAGLLRFGDPQWHPAIFLFRKHIRQGEAEFIHEPPPYFTGTWKRWDDRAALRESAAYRFGRRHGPLFVYDEEERLLRRESYWRGRRHGLAVDYAGETPKRRRYFKGEARPLDTAPPEPLPRAVYELRRPDPRED